MKQLRYFSSLIKDNYLIPIERFTEFFNCFQFRTEDLPSPYRVIRPRQGVTMDYRSNRLNVQLDENNVVTKVYYG